MFYHGLGLAPGLTIGILALAALVMISVNSRAASSSVSAVPSSNWVVIKLGLDLGMFLRASELSAVLRRRLVNSSQFASFVLK